MWESEMEVWRRLGKVLLALKQLRQGKLVESELRSFEEEYRKSLQVGSEKSAYFPVSWDQSSVEIRRVVKELERAVRRYLSGPPKLRGKAALARLVGSSTGPYETELGEGSAGLPARGQTIPLVVADLALPKSRLKGVRVVHLSPRVSRVLQDPKRRMLRPLAEAKALL